jgi:nucleoside-diphosphate kinase
MAERSFVMVKPDGVKRALVGEIVSRLERIGLKLEAMKMMSATRELVEKHYPATPELMSRIGNIAVRNFTEVGKQGEIMKVFGSEEPEKMGAKIRQWLVDYIMMGPVVAMIWSGTSAIKNVRRITGPTVPAEAAPGTIRGDYCIETAVSANMEYRGLYNLVHSSGNAAEAEEEIKLWFPEWKNRADNKIIS